MVLVYNVDYAVEDFLCLTGENEKYKNRVFLIYDGVHYDPLVRECQSSKDSSPTQTMFPWDDDTVFAEALDLSKEARQVGA